MDDNEFLDYCYTHAETPRCGFVPEQISRLLKLAGCYSLAETWDRISVQVINCDKEEIHRLVELGRQRQHLDRHG